MSDLDRSALRDIFVSSYETLQLHLTRRLGCKALAREALHDMYLRLHRPGEISVLQPRAYLLRMALNVAADNRRSLRRREQVCDAGDMELELRDEAADLVRAVAARQDMKTLETALYELTPRRRRILLESRLHGLTLGRIATRLGVSQRLVETELKAAVAYCAHRLERPVTRRFGPQMPAAPKQMPAYPRGHADSAMGAAARAQ